MSEESMGFYSWARTRMAALLGWGGTHNGMRNYDAEFGYPTSVSTMDLYRMYTRNGVASRIIRAFPLSTWEEQPVVRDEAGDSGEEKTKEGTKNKSFSPFVKSVNDFFQQTQALRYLERADRLSSVGHFGILVMGFQDGLPLSAPLSGGKRKLLYMSAYGEPNVEIIDYEKDSRNERFGLPTRYRVTTGKNSQTAQAPAPSTFEVHWSRCLHLAEFLDDSPVLGLPRLEPVYNHLLDLQKVVGSSAETFWRQSNPGLALSADSDAKLQAADLADMKEQAVEFENGMRRILAMQGITATPLGPGNQVADPATNVSAILDLIAGGVGMPKRILIGSERGELASSQDSDNWASRIDERQNDYAGPGILLPFVQKMVDTGNILPPEGIISVEWPESNALSPKDQAEVGRIKAETLKSYASVPNAEMIVPYQEFRTDFLGMDPESEYEVPEEEGLPEGEFDENGDPLALPAPEDEEEPEVKAEMSPLLKSTLSAMRRPDYTGRRSIKANAKPRSLYVRRDLLNGEDLRKHYKAQGLASMLEASDMHVTVCYSETPLDWMKVSGDWTDDPKGQMRVKPGGARLHDLFGTKKDTLVLLFNSSQLTWRYEDIKQAGATSKYSDYQPHVTLSFNVGEDVLERQDILDKLKPYLGELIFGPEVWEEINHDWKDTIKENVRAI